MISARFGNTSRLASPNLMTGQTAPIGSSVVINLDLIDMPFLPGPYLDPSSLHVASFPGYTQFAAGGPGTPLGLTSADGDLWWGNQFADVTWTCTAPPTPAEMFGVLVSLRDTRLGGVFPAIGLLFSTPVPIISNGDTITVHGPSAVARYAAFIASVTGTHAP